MLDAELREVLRARLVLRGRLEDSLQDLAIFSQGLQQNFSNLFFFFEENFFAQSENLKKRAFL